MSRHIKAAGVWMGMVALLAGCDLLDTLEEREAFGALDISATAPGLADMPSSADMSASPVDMPLLEMPSAKDMRSPDQGDGSGPVSLPDMAQADPSWGRWGKPKTTFTLPVSRSLYHPNVQASFPEVPWATLDRLYIKGGEYETIVLHNLPERSAEAPPLVITNIDGQVRVNGEGYDYRVWLGGGSNWVFTGRWDPVSETGDSRFKGHAQGRYSQSQGTYGFFMVDKNEVIKAECLNVGGGARGIELDFLELAFCGRHGVALYAKGRDMDGVSIHDLYVHDTVGEGMLLKGSGGSEVLRVNDVEIYNNRVVRSGAECLDLVELGGKSKVHHNVCWMNNTAWKAPYSRHQHHAIQLNLRDSGSVAVTQNVVAGAAASWMIVFSKSEGGGGTMDLEVSENYFSGSRGFGFYLHQFSLPEATYLFRDNVLGEIDSGQFLEVFPTQSRDDAMFKAAIDLKSKVAIEDNRWSGAEYFYKSDDGTKHQGDFETGLAKAEGNVRAKTMEPLRFVNSGWPMDVDVLRVERWASHTLIDFGGDKISYKEGDFVVHAQHLYVCLKDNTHVVPGTEDSVWRRVPFPPDDLRLAQDSAHQGVGLLDVP